jgi:hypothetical protein
MYVRQMKTQVTRKVAQAVLTGELADRFTDAASTAGISEADLVRQALRDYLGLECMKLC